MGDLDSVINNSKLPDQLKEYFKKSVRIKSILKVDTINDIEDIYIFYDSLYTFDSSDFSSCVVISLSKCTNFDIFYHYLKKVIDTSLERESRGEKLPVSNRFNIDNNAIDKGFVEVFNEFISIVDTFHNHELKEINLIQTYKTIGKMELINCLIDDKRYRDLLSIGKEKLNQYIKCDG